MKIFVTHKIAKNIDFICLQNTKNSLTLLEKPIFFPCENCHVCGKLSSENSTNKLPWQTFFFRWPDQNFVSNQIKLFFVVVVNMMDMIFLEVFCDLRIALKKIQPPFNLKKAFNSKYFQFKTIH